MGKSEVELVQLLVDGVDLMIQMERRLEKGEEIDDLIPSNNSAFIQMREQHTEKINSAIVCKYLYEIR